MYSYEVEKHNLFTEEGSELYTKIRDKVQSLLTLSGAVRWQEATSGICGDTWLMLACFDRMVELGELKELTGNGAMAQHRVFVVK
jgi:hypothetical protein